MQIELMHQDDFVFKNGHYFLHTYIGLLINVQNDHHFYANVFYMYEIKKHVEFKVWKMSPESVKFDFIK